ncbi:glycosyltransferase [Alphaproteobacteria bacterium]|nr:glycosyltransferase [Alphaproteobacteria bacterium]
MNKKKALIVLPSYAIGGAEKVIWSYFKNFKNPEISLKLIVVNSKDSYDNLKNKNIINLNYPRFIYSIPKILSILKKEKINVIISTFPNISAIFLLLKYLNFIKVKIIVRQPNIIEKSLNGNLKLFILKIIYKFLIKFTDAAIVTSEFMREEILKYNLKRQKVFLIRNPISVEETRKNITPVRLSTNNLTLIFVGRLVYQKGIDRVLHLLAINKNIELIVIGEGNFKIELLKKVKHLNIENKIKFLGKILKPYGLVAGADYFILPSRWEGLPNCVLESLALGTPVLSTKKIYGLVDFKKNISNKSILLFNSISELSKKIDTLEKRKDYRKPKLRKSLLIDYISPLNFNKKINKIILKIA